jgi:hypothetical protein
MRERASPKFVLTEEGCLWLHYEEGLNGGWWWELRDSNEVMVGTSDRGFDTVESCVSDAFEHGCLSSTVRDEPS